MHPSEHEDGRVGYVVKMYPRFSETFIVTEILAHERAGLDLEVFSLHLPNEGRFHESLARVRAPVTYLDAGGVKAADFWRALRGAMDALPGLEEGLRAAAGPDPREVYQAILIARAAADRGITHLHAHFATSATAVARLAAAMAGITYTFTAHAKDIYHESAADDDLRAKLRGAAGVVTVSEFNAAHLRERFGADARAVRRVYNGLDLAEFPFAPAPRAARTIVGVGRLVEKKGFDVLVAACAALRRRGTPFQCEIIGDGPAGPGLADQVTAARLGAQVRLLGPRPRGEVIRHIQSAAVLAAPCVVGEDGNRDGLPTVLLEAMALGTPCVATDVTGIPEAVRDGETGLIVQERDAEGLADALQRLLDDRPLALGLARSARRLVESRFDIDRNTAAIRSMFEQAVRSRRAGAPAGAAVAGGLGVTR